MKFLFLILISWNAFAKDPPFKPEVCYPPDEKNYPTLQPPIADTTGAECATNTTEMREKFPNVSEVIYRLEGGWTDGTFRRIATPLPKEKQYRDKTGHWIVNDVNMTRVGYLFNANKQGMWIQEQSDDKAGKSTFSNVMEVQICKKGTSMFLKTSSVEIPIAFPSKRCMLIGGKGKWHRFWRYQDIHLAFMPPTPDSSPETSDALPAPANSGSAPKASGKLGTK